ncbi:MAG: acetylxylan esterase [Dysgonamonadaceae bacterium]
MKKIIFLFMLTVITLYSTAQNEFEPNYDESKVPVFDLPNPLVTFNGKEVKTINDWENERRPELLEFFIQNVYGEVPDHLAITSFKIIEQGENALGGKAKRKQIELSFTKNGKELSYNILLYLPIDVEKAPIFLSYNFYGNHTVADDPNIIISDAWARNNESFGITNNQLTEQSRGIRTNRWAIEKMIDSGFGLATIYYGEIDPDKNDMTDGIHSLFYSKGQEKPKSNEWGSIAAWSWGLSRAMDYFEKDADIDASKVIVFGHSRLGKTSLWAGATDQRFAAVISNNSGCGGAALSKRKFGETIWRINNSFPHWFCDNFKKYNNNEEQLPVDQHELLALIAPRPLYVASAEDDKWADPRGEFLSAYYATPVYELYGKSGISNSEMPVVNNPTQSSIAYHIRTGEHDVTDYDWEQYIKWAKEYVLK